ncbi:unnamed protein product [Zymoseptoria tritici ST99CH_3D1]|nr:unnamed protein product [Zymoseptoria tritici ST99CH_3D1]
MASTTKSPDMLDLSTGNFNAWRGNIFELLKSKSDPVAEEDTVPQKIRIRNADGSITDSTLHPESALRPVKPGTPPNRAKGLHQVLTEANRKDDSFREMSMRAASIICTHVRIEILQRVPVEDLVDAPRLLAHLKKIAQPFRFLDLPTELRSRVYTFIPGFPLHGQYIEVVDILLGDMARDNHEKYLAVIDQKCDGYAASEEEEAMKIKLGGRHNIMPPVSQVCSTLRTDVAADIFTNSIVTFGFEPMAARHTNLVLKTWFAEVGQPHLQHIRRVCLRFGQREKYPKVIRIEADEQHQLALSETVSVYDNMPKRKVLADKQSRQLILVNQLSAPETRGEAILRMLLHDPELWATWTPVETVKVTEEDSESSSEEDSSEEDDSEDDNSEDGNSEDGNSEADSSEKGGS